MLIKESSVLLIQKFLIRMKKHDPLTTKKMNMTLSGRKDFTADHQKTEMKKWLFDWLL